VSHFVDKKLVAVTEGPDTIWIKPKLSFGERTAVQDVGIRIQIGDGDPRTSFASAAYQQELLVQSITEWTGPGWDGVPCTRESILALDYEDPLVVKVLEEITRRNRAGGGGDPKLSAPPSPPAGGNDSAVIDVLPIPPAAGVGMPETGISTSS
jgi:hypothetical protein